MKFLNLQNFGKHFSLHKIKEQRVGVAATQRDQVEVQNIKLEDILQNKYFQRWKYFEGLELKDYAAAGREYYICIIPRELQPSNTRRRRVIC